CRESCEFMRVVKGIKSGRCPPETLVSGEAATCVKACTNDANCSDIHKCCSNGCGWTCQQPTHIYDASTSSSSSSSLQSSSAASSIELKWNNVMNANSLDLVLYLVESRFNVGQQFDEAQLTNWTQVAQTTGTSTTLDAKAGHWYQYRVTAVNMYGSRGGSEPSQAFALSRGDLTFPNIWT
ncbi:hypothetical protein HELRODRAFT_91617, partial [Helobdella robusta]|uniref:WAP domain-containing protein n=1 Tax=Helobdella robusta TaxID=6412 RepID=T1G862_HELRO